MRGHVPSLSSAFSCSSKKEAHKTWEHTWVSSWVQMRCLQRSEEGGKKQAQKEKVRNYVKVDGPEMLPEESIDHSRILTEMGQDHIRTTKPSWKSVQRAVVL